MDQVQTEFYPFLFAESASSYAAQLYKIQDDSKQFHGFFNTWWKDFVYRSLVQYLCSMLNLYKHFKVSILYSVAKCFSHTHISTGIDFGTATGFHLGILLHFRCFWVQESVRNLKEMALEKQWNCSRWRLWREKIWCCYNIHIRWFCGNDSMISSQTDGNPNAV